MPLRGRSELTELYYKVTKVVEETLGTVDGGWEGGGTMIKSNGDEWDPPCQ